MQATWGFASAGADATSSQGALSFLSFTSSSTEYYSTIQYILYFSNHFGRQFEAEHSSNAFPNAKPLTLAASIRATLERHNKF
jgi:hypothetical protein